MNSRTTVRPRQWPIPIAPRAAPPAAARSAPEMLPEPGKRRGIPPIVAAPQRASPPIARRAGAPKARLTVRPRLIVPPGRVKAVRPRHATRAPAAPMSHLSGLTAAPPTGAADRLRRGPIQSPAVVILRLRGLIPRRAAATAAAVVRAVRAVVVADRTAAVAEGARMVAVAAVVVLVPMVAAGTRIARKSWSTENRPPGILGWALY